MEKLHNVIDIAGSIEHFRQTLFVRVASSNSIFVAYYRDLRDMIADISFVKQYRYQNCGRVLPVTFSQKSENIYLVYSARL